LSCGSKQCLIVVFSLFAVFPFSGTVVIQIGRQQKKRLSFTNPHLTGGRFQKVFTIAEALLLVDVSIVVVVLQKAMYRSWKLF
jgi:hypothetical protein